MTVWLQAPILQPYIVSIYMYVYLDIYIYIYIIHRERQRGRERERERERERKDTFSGQSACCIGIWSPRVKVSRGFNHGSVSVLQRLLRVP